MIYLKHSTTFLYVLIITCFSFTNSLYSQNTDKEQVKRVQRSIFIYNLAQQVKWENQEEFDVFKIGVLGPDRTILDLKGFAQKRKIQNKKVAVVRFNSIKDIQNVQALYVNNKYNFDVNYILNKIAGKNILLITEDYEYNSSMINMVNVGDSFEYEINNQTLSKENFTISPSLPQYAVTSSEKWKELYQESQKSLKKTEEVVATKETEIQEKNKELENQKETISSQETVIESVTKDLSEQEKNVEELITIGELQKQKFDDKLLLEKELEKRIQQQIAFINSQKDSIAKRNEFITTQKNTLIKQASEIEKKEAILEEKDSVIGAQRKVNWLLIAIAGLTFLGSILLYRNYLAKKRLNLVIRI